MIKKPFILFALVGLLFTGNLVANNQSRHIEYPTYYAHVNGISIAYQEFGDPANDTILLIMGLGGQLIHWDDDLIWRLVDAGYHVVRFDNRDAGWSSKSYHDDTPGLMTGIRFKLGMSLGAPYTLQDMADDAYGLIEYLNIKRAHVVGMSMGGMIAQIIAAQHPERIVSLTSIMSTSGAKHLPLGSVTLTPNGRKAESREAAIANTVALAQQIDGTVAELTAEQWAAIAARSYDRSHYPDGYARQFWAILDSGDRVDLLKTIEQPSVVIHGTEDNLLPPAGGEHTAELIAGSKLVLIEGMGHYIDQLSKPRIIAEIVEVAQKATP